MPSGWRSGVFGRTRVAYRQVERPAHVRHGGADRILHGQAAARAISIRFGRPPIAKAKMDKPKITLAAGKGVCRAARLAGISAASVSRLKHSMGIAATLVWTGEIPGYRPSMEDVRQQLN
jgi:hypothetical protein